MTSVISSVLAVFLAVIEWFVGAVEAMTPLFYVAETGLTFIGTITVIGVAIAITLLVVAMIRSLLRLR